MNLPLIPAEELANEARERRDIDWVKAAQTRYAEGFLARKAESAPEEKNAAGRRTYNQFHSFADKVEERCPRNLPAHEAERWKAGYLDADAIGTSRGTAYLNSCDPLKPKLAKRGKLAEPLEMFPEAIVSRQEGRRILHPPVERAPTMPDEQE